MEEVLSPFSVALYTSRVRVRVMHGAANVCHAFFPVSELNLFPRSFRRRLPMLHGIQLNIAPAAETWVFLQDLGPNSRPSQQTWKTNRRHENTHLATTVPSLKMKNNTTFGTRKAGNQRKRKGTLRFLIHCAESLLLQTDTWNDQ